MGFFDPATQRRSENITSVTVLPVAETQPGLHPGGVEGLCKDITSLISRQKRRKNINEPLIATLEKDLNKYESGLHNPASDRYMALIYPEMATAADYIPDGAVVAVCDHGNLQRAARSRCDEMGMQLDSMLGAGLVAGELCDYVCQWEDFCKSLRKKTVVYFDAFGGTSYPEDCPPKQLYPLTAKQLPGYGGNLDTAVSDLSHYQKMEFGSLVLCGTRRRAELLQQLLHEKGLSAFQCIPLTTLPKPGQILLTEGTLPFGMEYPLSKIAVLTEGQLIARSEPKRKPAKKTGSTNRQKLNSFTDLTPGDLVVHENYGIGRFVAMEQIRVDGAVKDYIKIAYQGSDTLFVPATQLDLVSKYIGGGGEDSNVKLNKIGSDAWQKTKAKARKAAKDMAGRADPALRRPEASVRLRLLRRRPMAEGIRGQLPLPGDRRPASLHRGHQARHGVPHPHGPSSLWRRGLRQDRGCPPRRDEGRHGRQAGGDSGSHHGAGPAALSDRRGAFPGLPRHHRRAQPLPHPEDAAADLTEAAAPVRVDLIIGTHKLLQKDRPVQGFGSAHCGRGAALRRQP